MISSEKTDLEQGVLGLQPREYILGIGCRRGKSFEELAEAARTDWNNELDHLRRKELHDQKAML